MVKKNINLLIEKELDSHLVTKLKLYLPVGAVVFLVLFIILFIMSITYTKKNLEQYRALKEEISQLEGKIDEKKNLEGVYTLSYTILNTIKEILKNKVTFTPLLSELMKVNTDNLSVIHASSDNKGKVNLNIIASSSAYLNNLVTFLHDEEDRYKVFSNMTAGGIIRNKDGGYELSISLKADESLYHEKTN